MPLKQITRQCRDKMDKSIEYFLRELRGIRTGRATTALVDYIKVDYYGSPTDIKDLASVSVPEPAQILIKPFDPSSTETIAKAIETADLGLNPQTDSGTIRLSVPPPSAERRKLLVSQVKKMAEDARVAVRNERRDANKHLDQIVKDKSNACSEDQGKDAKKEVDEFTKKHIKTIDDTCEKKVQEVLTI